MSDLVERLRDLHRQATSHYYVGKCTQEAADRIEALEAVPDLREECANLDYMKGVYEERIAALEAALRQSDEALNQMIIWMPSGFAPQSQANAMRLAYEARKVIARAALVPEQDK